MTQRGIPDASGGWKLPIIWGVDHKDRLVVATAEGVVRSRDIEEYLDSLSEQATRSFFKMFDMERCSVELSESATEAIGMRLRDGASAEPAAPVAIVAGPTKAMRKCVSSRSWQAHVGR